MAVDPDDRGSRSLDGGRSPATQSEAPARAAHLPERDGVAATNNVGWARAEAKLTLALWFAVMGFVVPAAIVSGMLKSIYDVLLLNGGLVTGLLFSALLFLIYRSARTLSLPGKVAVSALGAVACALLQSGGDFASHYLLAWLFLDRTPSIPGLKNFLMAAMTFSFIYACNVAIFWILDSLEERRSQESRLARSETRAATAELERLRLQLNPHFMSNSLNTVSALLMTQRYADADQVTRKLSDFLRAAASEQDAEVPLGEELGIVDHYLEVEGPLRQSPRRRDRLRLRRQGRTGPRLHPSAAGGERHQARRRQIRRHDPYRHRRTPRGRRSDHRGAEQSRRRRGSQGAPRPGGIGLKNIRSHLEMRYGPAAALSHEAGPDAYRATIRLPFAS